jgi:dTDP-4-amino-4,6-dideoxygalactose transaminase
MPERIYLSPPHMSGRELEYLKQAFKSNWIAPLGPFVDRFEADFCRYLSGGYAAAVSSGTGALHLLLDLLGIQAGDRIYCSSLTFCGSVNPVVYRNAEPVLVDCDRVSWNLDPDLLEAALAEDSRNSRQPKAVIAVHLYGQCADMDRILEICKVYDIPVIEDAAEALGARYKKRAAGTMGWASLFSFNGNKIITTSGGGMVWSRDEDVIREARFLATQARDPAPHYQHSRIGYNYRMSNLLAAVGVGQMEVLDERVSQARAVFEAYLKRLSGLPGLVFMPEPDWSFSTRWLTCITIDPRASGTNRETIRLALEKENIESRPLWKPMHLQPVFKDCRMIGGAVSESLFNTGLCLPSGTNLSIEQIERVCDAVRKAFEK